MEIYRKIYEALYPKDPEFDTRDVLKFLSEHPALVSLNEHHRQKRLFEDVHEELARSSN